MAHSEAIGELAKALSALQGEIVDASKDKTGYGYKYADLGQALEISRPLLAKHKLSIAQMPQLSAERVILETILMHESGQWLSSQIEMRIEPKKGLSEAQCVGSIITYARRYSLTAMLGITQVDDDAAKEPIEAPANLSQVKALIATKGVEDKVKDLLTKKNLTNIDQLAPKDLNKLYAWTKTL